MFEITRGFLLVLVFGICGIPAVLQAAENDMEKQKKIAELYEHYRQQFAQVEDISPEKAADILASTGKIVFIDTRSSEEMAVSALPGAITADRFLAAPQAYAEMIQVAYCTIGYRSGVFATEQNATGGHVLNLKEGILGWIQDHQPVYAEGKPVMRVHVYGKKWDLAPNEYTTVTFSLLQQMRK